MAIRATAVKAIIGVARVNSGNILRSAPTFKAPVTKTFRLSVVPVFMMSFVKFCLDIPLLKSTERPTVKVIPQIPVSAAFRLKFAATVEASALTPIFAKSSCIIFLYCVMIDFFTPVSNAAL